MVRKRPALLFVLFLLSSFSAYASSELRIIYTYEGPTFAKILDEFSQTSGIKLEASFKDPYGLKAEFLNAADAGSLPDAGIMPADHAGLHEFIRYSEVDPKLFNSAIPERIWTGSLSDGKFYGAPVIQGNHLMLFYNKALVKLPAKNWETMIRQKADFTAKGLSTIVWNYDQPYWFLPFLGAYGGWPIVEGGVALNTPATAAALDFYRSLYLKGLIDPNCKYQCSLESFKAGKAAYAIHGVWAAHDLHDALGENLGVTSLPMIGNRKLTPGFSTHIIAFPNNSLTGAKRTELIQLVNFLQSSTVQRRIWDLGGLIPVEPAAFDYVKKNAQGYLKQTVTLMSDTKPVPADQIMTFVWHAINNTIIRHREGVLDGPAAAKYMQKLAERHIRNAENQSPLKARVPAQD